MTNSAYTLWREPDKFTLHMYKIGWPVISRRLRSHGLDNGSGQVSHASLTVREFLVIEEPGKSSLLEIYVWPFSVFISGMLDWNVRKVAGGRC
jgi:hypothetical protein